MKGICGKGFGQPGRRTRKAGVAQWLSSAFVMAAFTESGRSNITDIGEQLVRYRGETETGLMKAIKAALDPKNIMHPGKVI